MPSPNHQGGSWSGTRLKSTEILGSIEHFLQQSANSTLTLFFGIRIRSYPLVTLLNRLTLPSNPIPTGLRISLWFPSCLPSIELAADTSSY